MAITRQVNDAYLIVILLPLLAVAMLVVFVLVESADELVRARRLPRRLAAGERAALAASVDSGFDPAAALKAARDHLEPALGTGCEPAIAVIEERFGRGALARLMHAIGWFPGSHRTLALEVHRPLLHVVDLERGRDDRVARAAVRVEVRVRGWLPVRPDLGRFGKPWGRGERLVSYFVVEHSGDGWALTRVEPGPAGDHRLRRDPSGEDRLLGKLRDDSLNELVEPVAAPAVPFEIATNLPGDAADALRDLAMIDDRFAFPVVEAAVRRLVDRWERAGGEDSGPLSEIAGPEAVRALLASGRVIRGAEVTSLRVTRVWALRVPPQVDVELWVRSWSGRGGSVIGSKMNRANWWRLEAAASASIPWRLVAAGTAPLPASAARHVTKR